MSSSLANAFEDDLSAADVPAVTTESSAPESASLSAWLLPAARSAFTKRELTAVLLLSTLFHAGIATAAYRHEKAPAAKHVSRVEIDLARPPERPKPPTPAAVPPPPPPKAVKSEPRPVSAKPEAPPEPTLAAAPPVDAGSSAPAAEDGELQAGSGGLGLAPPAPPAPPAPAAPALPAPVIQAREGANYLKNPRPAYPRQAKREGLEGTTLLRIWVQASGKPGAISIQKSSGHELLDDAAKEAVSKWAFVPATQGGAPVGGFVTVPIVFRLQ